MPTSMLEDPLLHDRPRGPDRPHYAVGVALDDEDFIAEQTYHRGRLARSLAALHGAGTVVGLSVDFRPAQAASRPGADDARPPELRVHPGLAIDGFGRLIELPRSVCIDLERWFGGPDRPAGADDETVDRIAALRRAFKDAPRNQVVADVFLRFHPCGQALTQAFARGAADALDAVVPERVLDGAEVRLVPRAEDAPAVPVDRWAGLAGGDLATRVAELRQRQLAVEAWPRVAAPPVPVEVPPELGAVTAPGLARGLAPGAQWVLLARVSFAVSAPTGTGGPRWGGAAPVIDNLLRPMVLAPGALAALLAP